LKPQDIASPPSNSVTLYGSGGRTGLVWLFATLLRLQRNGEYNYLHDNFRLGTSAGALTSVMLSSKLPLEKLLTLSLGEDVSSFWRKIPSPSTPNITPSGPPSDLFYLPRSLISGDKPYLRKALFSLLPESNYTTDTLEHFIRTSTKDRWPKIATWVTATEKNTGKVSIFSKESGVSLAKAVTASCAIPGVYAPVAINGTLFQDGGVYSSTYLGTILPHVQNITLFTPLVLDKTSKHPLSVAANVLGLSSAQALKNEITLARELGKSLTIFSPRESEKPLLANYSSMDEGILFELARKTLQP